MLNDKEVASMVRAKLRIQEQKATIDELVLALRASNMDLSSCREANRTLGRYISDNMPVPSWKGEGRMMGLGGMGSLN